MLVKFFYTFLQVCRRWRFAHKLNFPRRMFCRPISLVNTRTSRILAIATPPSIAAQFLQLEDPNESFRLIAISPGRSDDTVKCTTISTSYREPEPYYALSYTWGSDDPEYTIEVDGQVVEVNDNLWNALYYIRDTESVRYLWVDKLCINQKNSEEKDAQFSLMPHIYRKADEVLLWLGNQHTHGVLTLSKLSDLISRSPDQARQLWTQVEPWLHPSICTEYWKRAWIVQEVVAASQVRVCFGFDGLKWDEFIAIIKTYQDRLPHEKNIDNILRLDRMRSSKYDGLESLSSLMREFQDCFCEDPRDKIYAFLGLAGDRFNKALPVKYQKPLPGVYQDFVTRSDRSDETEAVKEAELVYMSAFVRQSLLRESAEMFRNLDSRPWAMVLPYENPPTVRNAEVGAMCSARDADFNKSRQRFAFWHRSKHESLEYWQVQDNYSNGISEVTVRGVIACEIERLGPFVEDTSSLEARRSWNTEVCNHYGDTPAKKRAIGLNELLLNIIKGRSADSKLRNIGPMHEYVDGGDIYRSPQRLFIGTNAVLGVVPLTAKKGDLVVQFWNSSASAVVRSLGPCRGYELIGRSGIVRPGNSQDFDIPSQKELFTQDTEPMIKLKMDIQTLTQISLDTVMFQTIF